MTDVYKVIHPINFFNNFLSRDVRPDGRKFDEHRNVKLNVNCIRTADASAVVKCGNTTVVCGIQLELAPPKAEKPDVGFLVVNVELLPISSLKTRPGPPSEHAQVVNKVVSDIIQQSKCVDLKELCIVQDKLAWVIHCDAVCIDNDGSVVDACIIGLMTCLRTLTLPLVSFDPDTEEIEVDAKNRTTLKVSGLPVATSFCILENNQRIITLTEPSSYEEDMCGGCGANLVLCWNEGLISGIQKFGGYNLTLECQKKAMQIAKERFKAIQNVIDVCLNNAENENIK